ncbi:MAG: TonB-dependent receptor [Dysgonamonadaceae bacterium]|nr:TonB-dependent receptor [Dysgonamonadaceae bacterium]
MKKFTINLFGKSVLLAFLMLCGGNCYNGFIYADEKEETSISQENIKVTGVLKDVDGEPLTGVSVTVVGTGIGTASDTDGKFRITVPDTRSKLEFRYLGFVTKIMTIGNQTALEVVMEEDSKLLDEVVVVGYGSLKRSDLTGAVGSVSMPVIQASGQTNTYGGMTGAVSGVNIIRNNNKPGGTFDITIRGLSSISGTNSPLIVIDGIPVPTVSGNGQTGNTSGLETINPDDIEKIDILKDASSTAIYGSRASNGVILVTTKRGAVGKPKITYSGYGGWRSYTNLPEMMSGDEWVQLARESYRALNNNVYRADEDIFTNPSELKAVQDHNYFDWIDAISNPAFITNHSVQAAGGTETAKYLFSGGYYYEDGMVNPQDFTRYTMRSATDVNISKQVTFGGSLYLTYSTRNTGNSDLAMDALRHRPTEHPYSLVDGTEQWRFSGSGTYNSLVTNENEINRTKSLNLLGNVYLTVTPIAGLELRSSFSPRFLKDMQGQYRGTWTRANQGANKATSNYRKNDYTDYVWDNIINYQWRKGVHNLNLTGVYSMQQNVMEGLYGLGNSLSFNSLWYNLQGGTTNSSQSSYSQTSLMSYLARANYSLMDKYLFTASVRYDGSSKLAKGNKWGLFPSVAIAWRISEEAFMKNLAWLSNFKLRLSYGQTGNDSVGAYSTEGTISGSQYAVLGDSGTGVVGTVPNNLRNTKLSWERSTEYNLGLDLGVFDSRLTASIELYNRLTTDLIMPRAVPVTTGYSSVTDNVGSVRNSGIEMTFNTVNIKTRDFQWTTNFNLAYNKNEIVDLAFKEDLGVYSPQIEGMTGNFANKWIINQPIDINWRYQTLGVWQLGEETEAAKYGQKPGQYKVRDWNSDGVINDKDRFIYGKRTPDWIGGMTNVFNYRNFDFSFNMYFQAGAINNSPFYVSFALEANNHNFNNLKKDYWTPENPTNSTAQPSNMGNYRNEGTHTYFKTDFLKVGYTTLGYTLPKKILKNLGLSQFRFYCTVQNPFTFTDYIGFDPGQAANNINVTDFMTRNTLLGINVSF